METSAKAAHYWDVHLWQVQSLTLKSRDWYSGRFRRQFGLLSPAMGGQLRATRPRTSRCKQGAVFPLGWDLAVAQIGRSEISQFRGAKHPTSSNIIQQSVPFRKFHWRIEAQNAKKVEQMEQKWTRNGPDMEHIGAQWNLSTVRHQVFRWTHDHLCDLRGSESCKMLQDASHQVTTSLRSISAACMLSYAVICCYINCYMLSSSTVRNMYTWILYTILIRDILSLRIVQDCSEMIFRWTRIHQNLQIFRCEAWPAATDGSSVERLAVPGGAVMVKSYVTP